MSVHVELLASPFCMADRDNETIGNICKELSVSYRLLNMWDIDDSMAGVPDYIASLIMEYRSGERPGNLYSNAFVNGQRVLLDKWPKHLDEVKVLIQRALKGEAK